MPIGVIINALSVAVGGAIGALFGHKLPVKFNAELTKIFGVCAMGMGVSSIGHVLIVLFLWMMRWHSASI